MYDTVLADKWVDMARRLIAIAAVHDERSGSTPGAGEERPSAQSGDAAPAYAPSVPASARRPRRRAAARTATPARAKSTAGKSVSRTPRASKPTRRASADA